MRWPRTGKGFSRTICNSDVLCSSSGFDFQIRELNPKLVFLCRGRWSMDSSVFAPGSLRCSRLRHKFIAHAACCEKV